MSNIKGKYKVNMLGVEKDIYHLQFHNYLDNGISTPEMLAQKPWNVPVTSITAGETYYIYVPAGVQNVFKNGLTGYIKPRYYWRFNTKLTPTTRGGGPTCPMFGFSDGGTKCYGFADNKPNTSGLYQNLWQLDNAAYDFAMFITVDYYGGNLTPLLPFIYKQSTTSELLWIKPYSVNLTTVYPEIELTGLAPGYDPGNLTASLDISILNLYKPFGITKTEGINTLDEVGSASEFANYVNNSGYIDFCGALGSFHDKYKFSVLKNYPIGHFSDGGTIFSDEVKLWNESWVFYPQDRIHPAPVSDQISDFNYMLGAPLYFKGFNVTFTKLSSPPNTYKATNNGTRNVIVRYYYGPSALDFRDVSVASNSSATFTVYSGVTTVKVLRSSSSRDFQTFNLPT